jgi:hypothetical protein
VTAPRPAPDGTELGDRLAAALPHTMGCVAHRSAGPSGCICFHDKALARLLPVVQQYAAEKAAEAFEAGRASVGLGDFLPDPCGEEERAPSWHFMETYGDWLPCSRRRGHDGDHEHTDSGLTWAALRTDTDEGVQA